MRRGASGPRARRWHEVARAVLRQLLLIDSNTETSEHNQVSGRIDDEGNPRHVSVVVVPFDPESGIGVRQIRGLLGEARQEPQAAPIPNAQPQPAAKRRQCTVS